jgi:hypothetical protein
MFQKKTKTKTEFSGVKEEVITGHDKSHLGTIMQFGTRMDDFETVFIAVVASFPQSFGKFSWEHVERGG